MYLKTARDIINAEFHGNRNALTPRVIRFGKLAPRFAFELSWGAGLFSERLYGVTVVEVVNDMTELRTQRTQLSKAFSSLHEAEDYIARLTEHLKRLPYQVEGEQQLLTQAEADKLRRQGRSLQYLGVPALDPL